MVKNQAWLLLAVLLSGLPEHTDPTLAPAANACHRGARSCETGWLGAAFAPAFSGGWAGSINLRWRSDFPVCPNKVDECGGWLVAALPRNRAGACFLQCVVGDMTSGGGMGRGGGGRGRDGDGGGNERGAREKSRGWFRGAGGRRSTSAHPQGTGRGVQQPAADRRNAAAPPGPLRESEQRLNDALRTNDRREVQQAFLRVLHTCKAHVRQDTAGGVRAADRALENVEKSGLASLYLYNQRMSLCAREADAGDARALDRAFRGQSTYCLSTDSLLQLNRCPCVRQATPLARIIILTWVSVVVQCCRARWSAGRCPTLSRSTRCCTCAPRAQPRRARRSNPTPPWR